MLKFSSVLIRFSFIIILNNYHVKSNIFSYLEKYDINFKNIPLEIQKQIEILSSVYTYTSYNDLNNIDLCTLSKEKKISLCETIFSLNFYKSEVNVHLNKIAFYKSKVTCEEKLITLKFIQNQDTIFRKMYPCFGRNHIIRTSFVEDDFCNFFYLSNGFEKNSIVVYMYDKYSTSKSFYIFDLLRYTDLSDLKDISITEKDVLSELKLNKKVISTITKIADLFIEEQDYLTDDSVCDLEYEKKITLCNIIFNEPKYRDRDIILNTFASYLYNMRCITRSVYYYDTNLENSFLLKDKQKLYSCYARHKKASNKILIDSYLKAFYISGGPRKNSVMVYFYVAGKQEIISLFHITENINFKSLKPTTITITDLAIESHETFLEVSKIIQSANKQYGGDLSNILLIANNEEEELKMLEEIVDENESDYTKKIENLKNRSVKITPVFRIHKQEEKKMQLHYEYYRDYLKENLKQMYFKDEDMQKDTTKSLFYVSYDEKLKGKSFGDMFKHSVYVQLGVQIFKQILDNRRLELSNKNIIVLSNNKEKVIKLRKTEEKLTRNKKLTEQIQALIRKMRLFVVERNVREAIAMRNKNN